MLPSCTLSTCRRGDFSWQTVNHSVNFFPYFNFVYYCCILSIYIVNGEEIWRDRNKEKVWNCTFPFVFDVSLWFICKPFHQENILFNVNVYFNIPAYLIYLITSLYHRIEYTTYFSVDKQNYMYFKKMKQKFVTYYASLKLLSTFLPLLTVGPCW